MATLKEKIRNFVEERPVNKVPKPGADYLTKDGREKPNGVPMAPPIGYKKTPSLHEQIRAMVQSEHLRRAAEAEGLESLEEADDFEIGDDFDPTSPYEYNFDPPTDVHPGTMGASELAEYNEWRATQFEEWKQFRKAVRDARNQTRPANEPDGSDDDSDRSLESRVNRAREGGRTSPESGSGSSPPLPLVTNGSRKPKLRHAAAETTRPSIGPGFSSPLYNLKTKVDKTQYITCYVLC